MVQPDTEAGASEVSERTPLISFHEPEPKSEVREILRTALPLVVFCCIRYWIIGISIISTGHLGVTELAAASLGMLHTNVVGLSIIIGSNSALDTLANQAAGSRSTTLASLYTLRQMVVQITLMPIMFLLMWYGTSIVHFMSPKAAPEVLGLTKTYLRIMFWALPAYTATDCLRRFCASRGNLQGPTIANGIGMPVSIGVNYLLVYGPDRYRLGFIGAPIGVLIAYYCIFFVMLAYALLTTPKVAWCGFSRAIFQDLSENVRLGVAGVVALCSEWWAFEALGIGSTYLGTAQATTAVFISVLAVAFPGPYAISLAASIRVGNLLGAGKEDRARDAASAAQKIALFLVLGTAGCLLLLRSYVALFYTKDDRVLEMVQNNFIILVCALIADGMQCVNGGILRGAGLPDLAAQISVTAYWGVGLWISVAMLYKFWNFASLWSGLLVAIVGAQLTVWYKTNRVDWECQAHLATLRMASSSHLYDDAPGCEEET